MKMYMRAIMQTLTKSIFCFTFLGGSLFLSSCGTEEGIDEVKVDFQWRYDTLRYRNKTEHVTVNRMWGVNRSSLYVIVNFPDQNMLMKLTENRFSPVFLDPSNSYYLPDSVYRISDIDGTSPSNIWIVGTRKKVVGYTLMDSSYVAKYDGANWVEYDLEADIALFTVAVVDEHSFFAGGHAPGIVHYENGTERFIPLPEEILDLPHKTIFCSDMHYTNGVLYASGYLRDLSGSYRCFRVRYENDEMASLPVVGFNDDVPARGRFWTSAEGTTYSIGTTSVYKGSLDSWDIVYAHNDDVRGVFGTSDNNFWIVGVDLCSQYVNGMVHQHLPVPVTDLPGQYNHIWTDGDIVVIAYRETASIFGDIILFGR